MIVDGTASPEASSQGEPVDISAMSRRYRLVWWALRVFYGIAFAAFVALYSVSLAKAMP